MPTRDLYTKPIDIGWSIPAVSSARFNGNTIVAAFYLMAERIRGYEIWENFGIPPTGINEIVDSSAFLRTFRSLLFSRIMPCVRDIGLWSERVREACTELGMIDMPA
jgi:hypothetical protein